MTKVIVAQGNPGAKYRFTRHNFGFLAVDYWAKVRGLTWKKSAKFDAETIECVSRDEKVVIAKPQRFYNETGEVVRKIAQFYKIDVESELLVICDDLNLDYGVVRTRLAGSDGGNNGLKSIIQQIGEDFARMRIGTSGPDREKIGDVDFVLSKFRDEEKAKLPEILERTREVIDGFINDKFETISKR